MNFKIVEGTNRDYWDNYEEFIQLYNENKIPVKQIKETLQLTNSKYTQYKEKAIEENRLNKRTPVYQKGEKFTYPKYYHKNGQHQFIISKNDGEKTIHYGSYEDENITKKIVEKLKHAEWDKKELPRILKEVGL